MASGHPRGGGGDVDNGSREKSGLAAIKVYTRRLRRKSPKPRPTDNPPQPDIAAGNKSPPPVPPSAVVETVVNPNDSAQPIIPDPPVVLSSAAGAEAAATLNGNADVQKICSPDNHLVPSREQHDHTLSIDLSTCSPEEARELRRKLMAELEQVRALLCRLESLELELASIPHSHSVAGCCTPHQISAGDPKTPMAMPPMEMEELEPVAPIPTLNQVPGCTLSQLPTSHTKTPLIVVKLGQANSGAVTMPLQEPAKLELAERISSSNSASHTKAEPPFVMSQMGESNSGAMVVTKHGQSNQGAVSPLHRLELEDDVEPVAPMISSNPMAGCTLPQFQETHSKPLVVVKQVHLNPPAPSQLELAEPNPPSPSHPKASFTLSKKGESNRGTVVVVKLGRSNSGAFSHLDHRMQSDGLEPVASILPLNRIAGCTPLSQFQENHPKTPLAVVKRMHSNSRDSLARLHRQLSLLVPTGTEMEGLEKEKRTPKANKMYLSSDFILGKDKLPSADSKKARSSGGKFYGSALKSCRVLLAKLMNHNYAWVFNQPVDVEGLRLYDYYTIIKHPMDLGSIKSRLANNFYRHPREFAEDVRLTFCNAMTYNPRGQDVHKMAEHLLQIFEDQWPQIERQCTFLSHPPLPKKSHSLLPIPATLVRSDSTLHYAPVSRPPKSTPHISRFPALQKPKATDPHKRNMTSEEKLRLTDNLSDLPPEKIENILQITQKRNSIPIEDNGVPVVNLEILDVETLWELDRLVTNYKKNLSKIRRRAELATLARQEAHHNMQARVQDRNTQQAIKEVPKSSKTVADGIQVEKKGDDSSKSSTSDSSSSSGSGSSSSDSDSSSSSG